MIGVLPAPWPSLRYSVPPSEPPPRTRCCPGSSAGSPMPEQSIRGRVLTVTAVVGVKSFGVRSSPAGIKTGSGARQHSTTRFFAARGEAVKACRCPSRCLCLCAPFNRSRALSSLLSRRKTALFSES